MSEPLQFRSPQYHGKLALCFLVVQNPKNFDVFRKWYAGYEDYINIYAHISGPRYDDPNYEWIPEIWSNRVDVKGPCIEHIATKWGTLSLVKAESILYQTALADPDNKYFCLLSESDIPVWSFEDVYKTIFKNPNKSFLTYDAEKSTSHNMFSDIGCFPAKYIPTTKEYKRKYPKKTKIWDDLRRWTLYNAHQWKVLNRRDASEFVKMAQDSEYMYSYDNCFTYDPEALAADEYAFPNWIVLKDGPDGLKKRFNNVQTTFVDYPEDDATHPLEYDDLNEKVIEELCEDGQSWNLFARKFKNNPNLVNEIPLKCPVKKGRRSKRKR